MHCDVRRVLYRLMYDCCCGKNYKTYYSKTFFEKLEWDQMLYYNLN